MHLLPARREAFPSRLRRYVLAGLRGESIPAARYLSPKRIARITEAVASLNPDLVILGDTYMASLLPRLRPAARRVVVDTHNVESVLWRRVAKVAGNPLLKLKYLWLARNSCLLEHRYFHLADEIWAVSEADAHFYRRVLGLRRVAVVPNVVDVSAYRVAAHHEVEPGSIVFTGWYGHWPNEDAAIRLMTLSRRLLREGIFHKLYVVGREPTTRMYRAARGLSQVVITGEVPDTRAYVGRASVFAAPLRAGSGTKFKLLEALAMGRPVVTTSVGAEGIDLVAGKEAIIEDDVEGFYKALRRLLDEPDWGTRLGAAGRARVEQTYSLEALRVRLHEVLAPYS